MIRCPSGLPLVLKRSLDLDRLHPVQDGDVSTGQAFTERAVAFDDGG